MIALGTLAVCIWLGVSMLVPQSPFEVRNIAGGVCLIVFSGASAVVAGLIAWFSTGGVCLVCDESDCC
jgi:hypothetical protein